MTDSTFMKQIYASVREAVVNEPGRSQIKGLNPEALIEAVQGITGALDKLPTTTNLHVLYFAVTYVRNAIALAMEESGKTLATETGGHA